ncbi:MAG: hypothetical protein M3Q31_20485, partial [Actinomycetota bacterium]|nr:hypothetical protein [Actinomycetota bacterium]
MGLFVVGAIGMFIAAAAAIFQRPQTYRSLADHGVLTLATVHCGRDDCDLTYTYAGRKHTNRYGNDLDQFSHWPPRTLVLVDPSHPATMFTVHDVHLGTNAGLGVYSVFTILAGLFFGGMALIFFVSLRNLPDPPPPPVPPRWDASPMARSLYATDQVQELLDRAYPLPGYQWYRVDPHELAASVEEMRRNVAAIPGPQAQALDAADRVAQEVRAGPRIPIIGGAPRTSPRPVRATRPDSARDHRRDLTCLMTLRALRPGGDSRSARSRLPYDSSAVTYPGHGVFRIDLLEQGWLDGCEAESDLCSHGRLRIVIGQRTVADGELDVGISESALALLRTLDQDRRSAEKQERLIFHGCGAILMMGCPIGIDWDVVHDGDVVRLRNVIVCDGTAAGDERDRHLSIDVPATEYREQVVT